MKSPISTDVALRACLKLKKILSPPQPTIFLAAMPKSASTFLHRTLMELTGFESVYFASGYRNIEQELYLPSLIDCYDVATVTQQHPRANRNNLELMDLFDIKPVILVREIPDVLISMRDHLLRESLDNLPGLYVSEAYPTFDEQQKLDFVVAHEAPWLVSFFASWAIAREKGELDCLWLNYQEVTGDSKSALRRVRDFYGLSNSDADIDAAVNAIGQRKKSKLRINKGVVGRGIEELSGEHMQFIRKLAAAYRGVDFSSVGVV